VQTLVRQIPYASRNDTFRLWHLTDQHIGARACAEKLLKRHIAQIADDEHAFWIGGGDLIDCIARKGDKRYDEETLATWLHGKNDVIGEQRDYALDLLKPIASKCLGIVEGNHERAALSYYDRNIYKDIVKNLAQESGRQPHELALGVQGFILLRFRRGQHDDWHKNGSGWTLTIYTHHGAGGGALPGGHALTLGRILGRYDCDLALLGHRHVEVAISQTTIAPTAKGVRKRQRVGMFVASYLDSVIDSGKTHLPIDMYAELKMLPPQSLGASPILIDPDERQFHVVLSSGGTGVGEKALTFEHVLQG
jgi:hypothetical protein